MTRSTVWVIGWVIVALLALSLAVWLWNTPTSSEGIGLTASPLRLVGWL